MKKIILLAALFTTLAGHSQDNQKPVVSKDSRNRIHFGLKAGINHSNVYDAQGDAFSADPKYGFAGGAFLNVPIGKFLGIHPEILYSQKGFKGTGYLLGDQYNLTRTTSYIDVPVLVAFKPARFLTIVGGPQYSYLINQTDILRSGRNSAVQEEMFHNDNIRRNILSGVVGVDVNITRFVFGARYGWDMQRNNGDGTSSTPRYKNVWFQATVGCRLF